MNRIYRDINMNAYSADIVIRVNYNDGDSSEISFKGLIKSGRNDLNATQNDILHPDANKMVITLLPTNDSLSPLSLEYIGTWNDLVNHIKSELIKMNRNPISLDNKISFQLVEDKTKVINFIKVMESNTSPYTQTINRVDAEYASIEKLMSDIRTLSNNNNMNIFHRYIYDLIVNVK